MLKANRVNPKLIFIFISRSKKNPRDNQIGLLSNCGFLMKNKAICYSNVSSNNHTSDPIKMFRMEMWRTILEIAFFRLTLIGSSVCIQIRLRGRNISSARSFLFMHVVCSNSDGFKKWKSIGFLFKPDSKRMIVRTRHNPLTQDTIRGFANLFQLIFNRRQQFPCKFLAVKKARNQEWNFCTSRAFNFVS